MNVAVLMPAYDENERLLETLGELARVAGAGEASFRVFLVDDGSDPPIDERVAARSAGAMPLVFARHSVNLGQGASLETARRLALDPRFSPDDGFAAYVTMDSDGQHCAADVVALARAIVAGADVALGNRFAGRSEVPRARRVLLGGARVFERTMTGIRLSDAHNGLRAFCPRAIARLRIRHNRMAHATEITRAIAGMAREDGMKIVEVPVSVRYTKETLAKGQHASGAVAIMTDLFRGFLFGE